MVPASAYDPALTALNGVPRCAERILADNRSYGRNPADRAIDMSTLGWCRSLLLGERRAANALGAIASR